jgi:HPt (histidine-containing phosphotransfer) domain-containing protein
MVVDFINQQQEQVMEMARALSAKEYEKLSAISHNMRSSIVAVGLEALREPLLALETLVKTREDYRLVEETFREIQRINQAAIEELQSSLD